MTKTKAARGGGVTLPEVLIGLVVLAVVVMGFLSLQATIWGGLQSLLSGHSKLRRMAVISSWVVSKEASEANRIDSPPLSGSSDVLSGWKNRAPDGFEPINGDPNDTYWFAFCVRPNVHASGSCGSASTAPPCLYYYRGAAGVAQPAINAAVCGDALNGVQPEMLASHLDCPNGGGEPPDCFSRLSSEASVVRVYYRLRKPASGSTPAAEFVVDSSYAGQFN